MQPYNIQAHSIKRADKERCGDHLVHTVSGPYLLAAVADGVSRQPCDYLASETACMALKEAFVAIPTPTDMKIHLEACMQAAHRAVKSVGGDCKGMMCTLSAVVWEIGSDMVYYGHVGDTRIYHSNETGIRVFTEDDAYAQRYQAVVAGKTIERTKYVLNKAIGHSSCRFQLGQYAFLPGEALFLVSDGFYGAKPRHFVKDAQQAMNAPKAETAFQDLLDAYVPLRGDDLTGILIKRNS